MEGWLDKNKDPLNDSVVELLKKSSDPFTALIWADYVSSAEGTQRKGKGSQFITVGQRHKVCVCVCVRACVRACVRCACVHVCMCCARAQDSAHICKEKDCRVSCPKCKLDETVPRLTSPHLS